MKITVMADRNEKILLELLKKPGNDVCADCGSKSKMSLSYNLTVICKCNRKKSHTYPKP